MTARTLKTSRLILWKHKNIRFQLDEDDEVSCLVVICRKPYQDRLPYNVRDKVKDFWHLTLVYYQMKRMLCGVVYIKETMKLIPNT